MKFRGSGDPVLYLSNPDGMSREVRRGMLDDIAKLNELKLQEFGDPEIATRISPVRDGLPDADERAGADRFLERAAKRARHVRPGREAAGQLTPTTA